MKIVSLWKQLRRCSVVAVVAPLAIVAFTTVAFATHSWGPYHWARTANPFTLKLGDNVSATWDAHLATTSNDWNVSTVLDTTIVAGQSKGNCKPTSGRVEVCNKAYGFNGWLGLAQIWINSATHITQGVVKVNDTYFNTATYNTPAWRNLVMCQEAGHTLGLDHQDENFDNPPLGTCMDYSSDPTLNQHPNAHDYEQLGLIYAHLDSTTSLKSTAPQESRGKGSGEEADVDDEWGKGIRKDKHGRTSLYERDLGGGHKVFTFVFWTDQDDGK